MKITLLVIGKHTNNYIQDGILDFESRLKHYTSYVCEIIPNVKHGKISPEELKLKESKKILDKIQPSDYVVLLDERGKNYRSSEFATFINNHQIQATKHLVFIIGGAYGFDQSVYQRANKKLSLSAGTFSHQLIRILFLEQLYRAFTILRGEKYHNE